MKSMLPSLALASALFLVSLPLQRDAEAGGRHGRDVRARSGSAQKHVTRTGPGGATRSKDVRAERTETGYRRNTTWTDAQGRTATRDAEAVVDREAGTASKQVEWKGPDGATARRNTNVAKTETGREATSTTVRPDGSTVTRQSSVVRAPGDAAATR